MYRLIGSATAAAFLATASLAAQTDQRSLTSAAGQALPVGEDIAGGGCRCVVIFDSRQPGMTLRNNIFYNLLYIVAPVAQALLLRGGVAQPEPRTRNDRPPTDGLLRSDCTGDSRRPAGRCAPRGPGAEAGDLRRGSGPAQRHDVAGRPSPGLESDDRLAPECIGSGGGCYPGRAPERALSYGRVSGVRGDGGGGSGLAAGLGCERRQHASGSAARDAGGDPGIRSGPDDRAAGHPAGASGPRRGNEPGPLGSAPSLRDPGRADAVSGR